MAEGEDFPRMIRKLSVVALVALGLNGCGGAPKGASESASRLLAAVYADDRVAFEAEIDRAAVRDDVRRQVAVLARSKTLDVEGGPSEFALDRMIGPQAVRVVDSEGEALAAAPSVDQVTALMKPLDGDQACLRDAAEPERCLLTFAKEKGVWRLVGMQARDLRIEVEGD